MRWEAAACDMLVTAFSHRGRMLATERCVVHKLAVREIPHSGKPNELLDRCGISARHIVAAVKAALE